MTPTPDDAPPGYRQLRHGVAWAELPQRSLVVATGRDAVAFVDRFTTASLAPLMPGHGTESVFCDARGHVLAVALVLRTDDGLEIDAGAPASSALLEHLEHHHIREQVEFRDASSAHATMLMAGPAAADWLAARLGAVAAAPGDHTGGVAGGTAVQVVRIDGYGPDAFLLRTAAADAAALRGWLADSGLAMATSEAIETVRIEQRTPASVDIPEKTLPQELDLPARAICFTKGCYLGQETVARLDALGHVNRRLAVVGCAGRVPPPLGTPLLADGAPVATITSACAAPGAEASLALALVHRRGAEPTARLTLDGRPAWLVTAARGQEPG